VFLDIKKIMARRSFAGMRGEFYEDMAFSIRAGMSLNDILRVAASRAAKSGEKGLSSLLYGWSKKLGDREIKGSFAAAIKSDVPHLDTMVLSGFEEAGRLADGLVELSKIIKQSGAIKSAVLGAVGSPLFSLSVILAVAAFFGKDIMPAFANNAPVEKWPLIGQVSYVFTTVVANYIIIIVPAAIGCVWGFFWLLPNWASPLRKKLDRFAPFSLYQNYQSATFLVVMSSLIKAGLSLDSALRLLSKSGSRWMRMYLSISISKLGDMGNTDPSAAFDTGFFPTRIMWRIQDSAKRGGFAESIKNIADNSFDKISDGVVFQAAVINKVSFLITGFILIGLVAGVLQTGMGIKDIITAAAK